MTKSNTHQPHIAYRPDIDGLRGIAVLLVVLFHAYPFTLRAGFIGVDIFFVISGYLISSIISTQLSKGTFSFLDFYQKRVLRIFPALVLCLSITLILGWFTLISPEFSQIGKHTFAAATFTSNFVLWAESGYFDQASELKPLLHLWSLAIEEQFYIIYPFILWAGWKLRLKLVWIILIFAALSFGINLYYINEPTIDFYLPLARFWELMIGALAASIQKPNSSNETQLKSRSLYSVMGLSLIIFCLFSITQKSLFPGFWALVPTIGTALVISSGPNSFPNRTLLQNRFLTWCGKISYPLYLWHWVMLSLARVIEGDVPDRYVRTTLVIFSFLLSWATTKFVETPLRFKGNVRFKVVSLVTAVVSLGGIGLAIHLNSGFPTRDHGIQKVHFEGDTSHDIYHQFHVDHFYPCTPNYIHKEALTFNGRVRCFQSMNNAEIDIAIIGDSHAEHLFLGLAENLKHKNIVYYIKSGAPLIDNPDFDHIFTAVLENQSIKKVFINALWAKRNLPREKMSLTIKTLLDTNKEVFIFDDIPNFEFDPGRCKVERRLRGYTQCSITYKKFEDEHTKIKKTLEKLKEDNPALNVISSSKYFCDTSSCSMTNGQRILYRDSNHLNLIGSRFLAEKLIQDYPALSK